MLTRREAVLGVVATALPKVSSAKASQPITKVEFDLPALACDTHTHIYSAKMWAQRNYTPETNTPAEMTALHRALHFKRVVIVTPNNIYGPDNSPTIAGMKVRGANARGIASIDESTTDKELDRLERLGFRGIRKDLRPDFRSGGNKAARKLFETFALRIKRLQWNFELQIDLPTLAGTRDFLADSPVPLVVDHFALPQADLGIDQPGFADLVELIRRGTAYVKIAAAYRFSRKPDYSDVAPFASALIVANQDRILWATDWPHPAGSTSPILPVGQVTPYLKVDDGHMLNLFASWVPDAQLREKILVNNPARLYRF